MTAKRHNLTEVVAKLAQHSQRATYGAVGALVGLPAQSVMQGQSKCPQNSWVVSKRTGGPTGYDPSECAPGLIDGPPAIAKGAELAAWLRGSQ